MQMSRISGESYEKARLNRARKPAGPLSSETGGKKLTTHQLLTFRAASPRDPEHDLEQLGVLHRRSRLPPILSQRLRSDAPPGGR